MLAIKGITVYLYEETATGEDDFGAPIVSGTWVPVDNVLVGEPTTDEITSSTQLYGKKLAYVLGIPKGDTHDWVNKRIKIRGEEFESYGFATEGIEENIPLVWNKKVKVAKYG